MHVQPDETPVLKRAELKLSLLAKDSIRDSWEPEAPGLLQKIQEMMGVDYDFDVGWKAFIDSTEPNQKGLRQNPAPTVLDTSPISSIISQPSSRLQNHCYH
ncbi:hypothetical protein SISSUDRAFT_1055434 [Sistotremastrum suecicum HHB10207 ss-3]|uniref:Uncharacterized protein n=1 Tax=Sistotremastrum suecicum HHB10207 ss-3 TaxID=1314776 RepID=A0A165XT82_9AGAM|nr:hypothetical protein SISSUDRAFT_1055434 [Sistotremastrum suecicum HHB10207 ss-3]